jgi:hypothetical protein
MTQAMATGYIRDLSEARRAIALSIERQYYEPRCKMDYAVEFERFSALSDTATSMAEREPKK